MKSIDVTISIASFNTKKLLERCITSIQATTVGVSYEIIVVDNGSADGSAEMVQKKFPKVRLIRNKSNLFFSKAHNQALAIAKGTYFLILNSDAYFEDNSIGKMRDYLQTSSPGACEGLELYEDGTVLETGSLHVTPLLDFYELSFIGKHFRNANLIHKYRMSDRDRKDTYEIDVACDAFLMVPTKLLRDLGGYDVRLKLYYTENDISKRIQNQGLKVMHYGDAYIVHTVSVSAQKLKWKKLEIYYQDMVTYYFKHGYKFQGAVLFCLLYAELLALRMFRPHMFDK